MNLIDKDALVTEIERRIKELRESVAELGNQESHECGAFHDIYLYEDIRSFVDTLEVKEVDLEKEIQDHLRECLNIKFPTTNVKIIASDVEYTARKFFELGLKAAQKGE